MAKIAFVFPGQGSQYVGMGREIAEKFPEANAVFAEADKALGFSISELCFNGPEEVLKETENTQPAILTTSIAILRVIEKEGFKPAILAGHSLGEYSALVAAGAFSFSDAVKIVRRRGELMKDAFPSGQGGMAAVLGADRELINEVCQDAKRIGYVAPANYNCPGQIVIAGDNDALNYAMEKLKEKGAKRVKPLVVSGPFHTELIKLAGLRLGDELSKVQISNANIPVVSNYLAKSITDSTAIKDALVNQVSGTVLWEDSIAMMVKEGYNHFVEIGPGKVLCGLIKKIAKDVVTCNVEDLTSLEKTLAYLKEVE